MKSINIDDLKFEVDEDRLFISKWTDRWHDCYSVDIKYIPELIDFLQKNISEHIYSNFISETTVE